MMIAYQSTIDTTRALVTTFVLVFLAILSGAMYYTRRKNTMTNRRQVDLEAAREDSVFLYALRKLAASSVPYGDDGETFGKRLRYIDNTLGGL